MPFPASPERAGPVTKRTIASPDVRRSRELRREETVLGGMEEGAIKAPLWRVDDRKLYGAAVLGGSQSICREVVEAERKGRKPDRKKGTEWGRRPPKETPGGARSFHPTCTAKKSSFAGEGGSLSSHGSKRTTFVEPCATIPKEAGERAHAEAPNLGKDDRWGSQGSKPPPARHCCRKCNNVAGSAACSAMHLEQCNVHTGLS